MAFLPYPAYVNDMRVITAQQVMRACASYNSSTLISFQKGPYSNLSTGNLAGNRTQHMMRRRVFGRVRRAWRRAIELRRVRKDFILYADGAWSRSRGASRRRAPA